MESLPIDLDQRDLDAWRERHDDAAFASLVERHAALVHGVCRRRLGNGTDADQATQAAFLILARKAGQVRQGKLGPWLYGVALRTSRAVERSQRNRRHYEHEAAMTARPPPRTDHDAEWIDLLPHLDAALASLSRVNRQAVIGRLLEGRGLAEVGRQLGLSPDATRMRINTALDHLRRWFARRGLAVGVAGLLAAFAHESSAAEPALVTACVHSALQPSTAPAVTAIASKVGTAMLIARYALAATFLLLIGGGVVFERMAAVEQPPALSQVPLSVLPDMKVIDPVVLRTDTLRLSLVCRQLAGIDDAQTLQVETVLNETYDSFRAALLASRPVVMRSATQTTTIFNLEEIIPPLREAFTRRWAALADTGTFQPSQLACLHAFLDDELFGLGDLVPGLMTGEACSATLVVPQAAGDASLAIARGSRRSTYTTLGDGPTRAFLAAAGRPLEGPVRQPGAPFPPPVHADISHDPNRMPLAVLGAVISTPEGWFTPPADKLGFVRLDGPQWCGFDNGSLAPSALVRQIAGLDDRQVDAVTTAWSAVYDGLRRALTTPPPQVTAFGDSAWCLRVPDARTRLEPLRPRLAQALDPLVTQGLLQVAQATFLTACIQHEFDDLSFDYGARLEEVVLIRQVVKNRRQITTTFDASGKTQTHMNDFGWFSQENIGSDCGQAADLVAAMTDKRTAKTDGVALSGGFRYDGQGNGSRSEGHARLPDRLRVFLDILPQPIPGTLPPQRH